MPTTMSSPLVRSLLIYAGWFILPNSITNVVFICFIRLRVKINPSYRPPVRGTPQAAMLYRYCYASVIMAYLIITTIHTFVSMPLNFYEILNVDPTADDHILKVAFRQFARKNHPDRVGPAGEPLFIAVRDAYESLNDPVKRFAYDRFGSDAMTWKDCATPREYIKHGLIASSGYYIGTIGLLLLWSIFGLGNTGAYWRNLFFCTLFFSELYLILNTSLGVPDPLEIRFFRSFWFRKRVPYQYTLFLHQLYMSLSIAIARVVPTLFPSPAQTSSELLAMATPLIDKLALLATTTDQEVSRMLSMEFRSIHGSSAVPPFSTDPFALSSTFAPSEEIVQVLTNEMEKLIIDKQLQTKPALQSQWEAVVERSRQQQARSASPTDGRTPPSVTSKGSPFPFESLPKEEEEDNTLRRAIPLPTGESMSSAQPPQTRPFFVRSRSQSC